MTKRIFKIYGRLTLRFLLANKSLTISSFPSSTAMCKAVLFEKYYKKNFIQLVIETSFKNF